MAANSLHSREQPPSRTTPSAKNCTFDADSNPQANIVSSRSAKTDFRHRYGPAPKVKVATAAAEDFSYCGVHEAEAKVKSEGS